MVVEFAWCHPRDATIRAVGYFFISHVYILLYIINKKCIYMYICRWRHAILNKPSCVTAVDLYTAVTRSSIIRDDTFSLLHCFSQSIFFVLEIKIVFTLHIVRTTSDKIIIIIIIINNYNFLSYHVVQGF